jgi:hypothetical protein
MAEENQKSPSKSKKVSPARHAVSLVMLLIVGVICVIELRAGLGQMLSSKALAAKANDGEFADLSLKDARDLMKLAPKETVEDRGPDQVLKFEWYSLLRPLLQKSSPQITIVASNGSEPMALAFTTAEEEVKSAPVPAKYGTEGSSGGAGAMGIGEGEGPGPGGEEKNRSEAKEDTEDSAPASETPAPAEDSTPTETPAATEESTEPAKE